MIIAGPDLFDSLSHLKFKSSGFLVDYIESPRSCVDEGD